MGKKWTPPSTLPPRKSGRQIHVSPHECFTSWNTVEQCALCVYKPLLLTYREEEVGGLPLKLPPPAIFQTLPRGDAARFIWIHLLYTAHVLIIIASVVISSGSAVVQPVQRSLGQQSSLHGPSKTVVIYPDLCCHSSPGSRLPVFSLVASLPSMMEKISMLHAESLSYDKKKVVLLNKPDVNNCWKQYRALRRRVHLVFCLAVCEVAQFHSGPEMPF